MKWKLFSLWWCLPHWHMHSWHICLHTTAMNFLILRLEVKFCSAQQITRECWSPWGRMQEVPKAFLVETMGVSKQVLVEWCQLAFAAISFSYYSLCMWLCNHCISCLFFLHWGLNLFSSCWDRASAWDDIFILYTDLSKPSVFMRVVAALLHSFVSVFAFYPASSFLLSSSQSWLHYISINA